MPLVLYTSTGKSTKTSTRKGMPALAGQVEILQPDLAGVLEDWLSGIYTADTLDAALSQRDQLAAGEAYICPQGHIVSRYSVKLHATNATPFKACWNASASWKACNSDCLPCNRHYKKTKLRCKP